MSVVDLTAQTAVTTALLLRPLDWRVRGVESIEIQGAERCLRRRSLQCAPLRPLLAGVADLRDADEAFLVLNVATVPRGPLLDFNVQGPGGSEAYLLPRNEIAARELVYLEALVREAGVRMSAEARPLVEAVLGFTLNSWLEGGDATTDLSDYLRDGLGVAIDEASRQSWTASSLECARLLEPFRDVDGFNIALQPILALPAVRADRDISIAEYGAMLTGYLDLVTALVDRDDDDSPARDFLSSLVDYGHSYDMFVAVQVPLDRPFLLKYEESRGIAFSWHKRAGSQDVVIADAVTNHVSVRVNDPNVRISDLTAVTPDAVGQSSFGAFTVGPPTNVRAFYAHGDDRDFRVRLHIKLSPLRRLEMVNYFAPVLIAFVTLVLIREHPQGRDLALLAGPTVLSATVLLNREPTTLGSRLRVVSTALLAVALAGMAAVAILLYLF